ncbi:MAG: helix-turn-helix domain-containing protein [Endomicrobium sp.]|jgi:predicted DNA-binding transcriptional regulator AlpA|nr:helix-turn-helix domain-containing protein [Endomicrobium sp.]
MDIKELSRYLGIGKSKIYNLIRMKKFQLQKLEDSADSLKM